MNKCSNWVGDVTQAKIVAKLLECGYLVSVTYGNHSRYDLVIDKGNLSKVQCKTGRLKGNSIRFNASSVTYKGKKRNYIDEADYFAVYVGKLDKFYLVPVNECGKYEAYLMFGLPKNDQAKNIHWASDYELGV